MSATLVYEHPVTGHKTIELEDYHTQPNGSLIARASAGYRLLIPSSNDWIVVDGRACGDPDS